MFKKLYEEHVITLVGIVVGVAIVMIMFITPHDDKATVDSVTPVTIEVVE